MVKFENIDVESVYLHIFINKKLYKENICNSMSITIIYRYKRNQDPIKSKLLNHLCFKILDTKIYICA